MMTPDDFRAWLTIAREFHVEEFSCCDLAVKLGPVPGAPTKVKPEAVQPKSALDLVVDGMPFVEQADVVVGPRFAGESETTPGTNIQWADEPNERTKE